MNVGDLRLWLFVLIVLLYGGFSDPTPDQLGPAEALIGLGLVLLVGIQRGVLTVVGVAAVVERETPGEIIRRLLFVYLLFIPLAIAALRGPPVGEIIREILPMLFLFLPIFVGPHLVREFSVQRLRLLAFAAAAAGIALGIRHLFITDSSLLLVGQGFYSEHSLYLSTDSFVHFAAAFLLMAGIAAMSEARLTRVLLGVGLLIGGLACMGVLGIKGHRGPVLLVLLVVGFFVFNSTAGLSRRRVAVMVFGMIAVSGVFTLFSEPLTGLWRLFLAKHEAVGLSNRDAEFMAIVAEVFRSTPSAIFGHGFGSTYASPAAGTVINYAHWIAGYVLLKAGVVGLICLVTYFASYSNLALRAYQRDRVLTLAIAGPLVIGITVSGSYRFLSYGILLTMLYVLGRAPVRKLRHSEALV